VNPLKNSQAVKKVVRPLKAWVKSYEIKGGGAVMMLM